jgi:HEAT repeat protein
MISKNTIPCAAIAVIALMLSHSVPAGAADLPTAPASALIEKGRQGKLSEPEWVKALKSEDRLLREAAISLALRGGGGKTFIPSPDAMAALDTTTRAQLVSVLGMRGNRDALPAIRPSLRAEDATERAAAALAAGELADVASKDALIEMALGEGPAAEAAARALPRLADPGIDAALMDAFRNGEPGKKYARSACSLPGATAPSCPGCWAGSGSRMRNRPRRRPTRLRHWEPTPTSAPSSSCRSQPRERPAPT